MAVACDGWGNASKGWEWGVVRYAKPQRPVEGWGSGRVQLEHREMGEKGRSRAGGVVSMSKSGE